MQLKARQVHVKGPFVVPPSHDFLSGPPSPLMQSFSHNPNLPTQINRFPSAVPTGVSITPDTSVSPTENNIVTTLMDTSTPSELIPISTDSSLNMALDHSLTIRPSQPMPSIEVMPASVLNTTTMEDSPTPTQETVVNPSSLGGTQSQTIYGSTNVIYTEGDQNATGFSQFPASADYQYDYFSAIQELSHRYKLQLNFHTSHLGGDMGSWIVSCYSEQHKYTITDKVD